MSPMMQAVELPIIDGGDVCNYEHVRHDHGQCLPWAINSSLLPSNRKWMAQNRVSSSEMLSDVKECGVPRLESPSGHQICRINFVRSLLGKNSAVTPIDWEDIPGSHWESPLRESQGHSTFLEMCVADDREQYKHALMAVEKAQLAVDFYDHLSADGHQRLSGREANPTLGSFDGDVLDRTVESYSDRMLRYVNCSVCNVTIGLLYLERIKRDYPDLEISSTNLQRLLLVSVMVATKMFDDVNASNKEWAEVGELDVAEVNMLELKLLGLLNFNTNVSREEYEGFVHALRTCPRLISAASHSTLRPFRPSHNKKLSFSVKHVCNSLLTTRSVDAMKMDETAPSVGTVGQPQCHTVVGGCRAFCDHCCTLLSRLSSWSRRG